MTKKLCFLNPRCLFYCFILVTLALLIAAGPNRGEGQDLADQTGWLTFTEPGLGFQIDYPVGWYARLVADNTDRAGVYGEGVVWRSIGFFGPHSQIVFVDVWPNRRGLSPAVWLEQYPPPLLTDPTLALTTSGVAVDGQPAVRLAGAPRQGGSGVPWHYRTQFSQGDWMFAIEYAALEPDPALYETMVASFRRITPGRSRPAVSTLSGDLPPAEYGIAQATCCNITDPEYNPFPCNTAGDASCPYPPCGNCTWWVRYRRIGGSEANLIHCTNDAYTWSDCVSQYYPHLISDFPDKEAVTLYPGADHVSYVEDTYAGGNYTGSEMSWYVSCPESYFNDQAGGSKIYVHHPDRYEANEPPNAPSLDEPEDEAWLASHTVTLSWQDEGDPDDGPAFERRFRVSIWNDESWSDNSTWIDETEWEVELPADGLYTWRVKAHDGMLESNWSSRYEFRVDTASPVITMQTAPQPNRWYKTDQALSWSVADPSPGRGVDYFKWAWDASPDRRVEDDEGTVNLSNAGQGQHTLYLRAWDKVGNASATTAWGWLGYDTLAPEIVLAANNPAPNRWYNTHQDLAWTVVDPAPGVGTAYFKWAWDASPPANRVSGSQGNAALPQTQGQHTLYLQGADNLGNVGPVQSLGWFGYDSLIPESPQIIVDCGAPNNQWQNACAAPTFSWNASDADVPNAAGAVQYTYTWGITASVVVGSWGNETGFTADPVAPADGWARY